MKRSMPAALALCLLGSVALAGVKTVGKGDGAKFDPSGWPADMQKRYEVMEVKCNNKSCHSMGRTVEAIVTGIAPNSKTPFDKEAAKRYGIKMMRKPDSNVNKEEAKQLVELLYFLIDEAKK